MWLRGWGCIGRARAGGDAFRVRVRVAFRATVVLWGRRGPELRDTGGIRGRGEFRAKRALIAQE